jgi:hypothetical protein
MRASSVLLTIAVLAAAAGPAGAQGRGRGKGNSDKVPPGQRPPAGMCRIWINGVPPGHQPAPTDCQTAVRNQPPNSQIIWGDNTNRRDRNVYDDDRRDRRERDRDYDRDGRYQRDANGNLYDPTCVDNDRNGWCDYHPDVRSGVRNRRHPGDNTGYPGNTGAVDRGQYPSQLPAMTGATLIRVGVRTVDVQNWLGRGTLRSETSDSNGDGVPEVATWYDGNGTILQVWRDEDRDGRADSVDIYRNGQRVQVVR